MRLQFDLRPAEYLEIERKRTSFNPIRLLAILLLFAFLAICGAYIAFAFMEVQTLSDEIEERQTMVDALEAQQRSLTAEINRLKNRETEFTKTLRIMQNEPATLEVLNAIETHLHQGMGLNSIRFVPVTTRGSDSVSYNATVEATALTEEQIIAMTDGLSGSGVFSGVTMPSSQRDEAAGRVNFNLLLNVRPLGEISPASEGDGGKE